MGKPRQSGEPVVAGEGPSSTEYEKWLETRPDLIARFEDKTFRKNSGYEIWRNAWLILRSAYQAQEEVVSEVELAAEPENMQPGVIAVPVVLSYGGEYLLEAIAKDIEEAIRLGALTPLALIHECLKDEIADDPRVIELMRRVLPGYENIAPDGSLIEAEYKRRTIQ